MVNTVTLQLQTPTLRLYTRSCLTWGLSTPVQRVFGTLGITVVFFSRDQLCDERPLQDMDVYIYIYEHWLYINQRWDDVG